MHCYGGHFKHIKYSSVTIPQAIASIAYNLMYIKKGFLISRNNSKQVSAFNGILLNFRAKHLH